MKEEYEVIDSYDFAIDCMLNALRLPDEIIPPMQLQEAPGGYLINPEHVDAVESLHEMLSGVDYPQTTLHLKKPVQRLTPEGGKVTRHIRQ